MRQCTSRKIPPTLDRTMRNPLIMKLEHGPRLTDEDRAKLEEVCTRRRHVGPRRYLIREGDRPEDVHLVLEGFACRYKTVPDGHRQIMALLVPGDFCDLHVAILGAMDHAIAALSPCTVAAIPRATIEDLTAKPHADQPRPVVGDAGGRGHLARVAGQYRPAPGRPAPGPSALRAPDAPGDGRVGDRGRLRAAAGPGGAGRFSRAVAGAIINQRQP